MYGVFEGIVDAVLMVSAGLGEIIGEEDAVRQIKDMMVADTTGVGAARQQQQEFLKYNPWLNQGFGKYVYGAFTSIARMAPLALNIAVPGLGSAIYYTSLAGSTAEET